MKLRNLLTLLLLCCLSCQSTKQDSPANEKFDKTKWVTKEDNDYLYRDKMLKDLMTNHELHGVKKDELVNLLGPPTRTDSSYLFYLIVQERFGFLTLHTKTLVIKLADDSTVTWLKIHE